MTARILRLPKRHLSTQRPARRLTLARRLALALLHPSRSPWPGLLLIAAAVVMVVWRLAWGSR